MAEDLQIVKGDKIEQYQNLIPQIKGLLAGETDLIANLANITAALKEQFGWFWVGFILLKMRNWYWDHFRGLLPVHASKKAEVFVVVAGKKPLL